MPIRAECVCACVSMLTLFVLLPLRLLRNGCIVLRLGRAWRRGRGSTEEIGDVIGSHDLPLLGFVLGARVGCRGGNVRRCGGGDGLLLDGRALLTVGRKRATEERKKEKKNMSCRAPNCFRAPLWQRMTSMFVCRTLTLEEVVEAGVCTCSSSSRSLSAARSASLF